MAVRKNHFRWIFPLQHMVKVKIIESLWRNSSNTHNVKDYYHNSDLRNFIQKPTIDNLEQSLNKLSIPHSIKSELIVFVIEMVNCALVWLDHVTSDLKNQANYQTILAHYIDNFAWDNMGCVDSRKMLETYVSNKKNIDFTTWKLLCEYCMEDEIVKFSKKIDWNNYMHFTNNPYLIYWYWKIHGHFPEIEMFISFDEYWNYGLLRHRDKFYDENNIVGNMLEWAMPMLNSTSSLSAITYLKRELNDEKRFKRLYTDWQIFRTPSTIHFHWLRQMDESWLTDTYKCSFMYSFMAQWPWVIITEHWLDIIEDERSRPQHFVQMVYAMRANMVRWQLHGLAEKHYQLLCTKTVYSPFKELWKIFQKRFKDDNSLKAIHSQFFTRKEIAARQHLLDADLGKDVFFVSNRTWETFISNDFEFSTRFMERILFTGQENTLFQKIG